MKQKTNLNTDVDCALKKCFYCKANYFVFLFFLPQTFLWQSVFLISKNKYTLNWITKGKLVNRKTKQNKRQLTNTAILC